MRREFWRNKVVLVTGHTGFKGSWLCLWLKECGARVIGYALEPPSRPSLFEVAKVSDSIESHHGDIRDLEKVAGLVRQQKPDIVIHMAAQSLVRESYRVPAETYATNVLGTVSVLEAVRRSDSVRVFVNVTSDKCYENHEWLWGYREGEPLGGHDPYSSSKACAELVTAAYRKSFFSVTGSETGRARIASARAGNVIGGGDWAADRLIPDMVRALSENVPVKIRFPGAVRPWQHVLEPLHGYLMLSEQLWEGGERFAQAWNFGPELSDTKPVSWIVENFVKRWGTRVQAEVDSGPQLHEAHSLRLDSSKARIELGWKPRLSLETALEWTVAWYRAYRDGGDMRAFTAEQIRQYENMT